MQDGKYNMCKTYMQYKSFKFTVTMIQNIRHMPPCSEDINAITIEPMSKKFPGHKRKTLNNLILLEAPNDQNC